MCTTSVLRRVTLLAVFGGILGGVVALGFATAAPARVSSTPCIDKHEPLIELKLRNRAGELLGKTYVYDEGRYLCAVTRSKGRFWGMPKFMRVTLTAGGRSETDEPGVGESFAHYAGRVRLRDPGRGKCVEVTGQIYKVRKTGVNCPTEVQPLRR